MSLIIKSVEPDGLGAYLGLKAGDRLLKINGRKVLDQLDYNFRIGEKTTLLDLEIGGKLQAVEVDKDEETDLGVSFEDMPIRRCANDCIFCFVDQNPAGLRESLYFRDGDYRLSFLYGHYITLTNMGPRELERVVTQRMTPLYISIHATDPGLRRELLLYGKDDGLLDKLRYLLGNGINLHSQIVLCPTINDGQQLARTLDDLTALNPGLESVAIVPVGLTGHRTGLVEIPPVTPAYAEAFLALYGQLDRDYRRSDGGRLVLPSDEWYLLLDREVPPASFYAGLEMEENGVGQVRAFLELLRADAPRLPRALDRPLAITLATGRLATPLFQDQVLPRLAAIGNLSVALETVPNRLLGDPVTVAGLLSGKDFIAHLQGKDLGDGVWTTDRILNEDGITLDDMTTGDIGAALGVPFNVTGDSLLGLVREASGG